MCERCIRIYSRYMLTLHSYRRCPFAMRVRMLLHEKGIAFETIEESLKDKSEALLRLHPEGRVPLLVHDDFVLYESAIITEYIEDAFPEQSFMPIEAKDRASLRVWTYWCNHLFKKDLDLFKYKRSQLSKEEREALYIRLATHLQKIEDRLSVYSWLVGENYSLADIHVFPFFRQFRKAIPVYEYLDRYPATFAWLDTILARPAFEQTMVKTL